MKSLIVSAVLILMVVMRPAVAQQAGQDVVWVQIEAHPSLRVAQDRARLYSGNLDDVNGFALGGNWYGIVLGPYTREDADRVLQVYRAERQVPQDSFIAYTRNFGRQFWPVGADVLNADAVTSPLDNAAPQPQAQETAQPDAPAEQTETVVAEPALPEIKPADETPSEARQSESYLTAQERMDLQVALQSQGFYDSAIDGAFGRGTRASMETWQIANNYEATGILTTMQRKVLMDQYNAPLISVGMRSHADIQAGIRMDMPLGTVEFSRYEPPFAHYDGDQGIRVLLISQPGDQATLYGLYDIMQTLEIVPLQGPRERGRDEFTLEGRGREIVSYTQASLHDGQIKGFTLIWPVGDEERRQRVLGAMKASFERTDGVLDPAAGGDAEQSIDLVSGLQVRQPRVSRSGFYVDPKGTLVTTVEAVQNCSRITVDQDYQAEVVATDDALGVAVLRPSAPLAPISVAHLRDDAPRLQSDVAVAGYSYGGVLGAPTLTFGTLADIKGLGGEAELTRLALNALPGDAGGPVIDISGGVLGMLLPPPAGGRQLPENVSLAADATALRSVLSTAGLTPQESTERGQITPDEMNRIADGMTVLVSCWD